jgi:SpoVK/Ycf46/Vps4 family AAA+-type ATPase
MQNLLLQELENFEGIFIATTNLEDNLDKAFDRRLLYKVKFELPSPAIRKALWAEKLPGLSEEMMDEIGTNYLVSGGQIDNICKKIQVEMLLDPALVINLSYLRLMIEQETILQNKGKTPRNPIGYKQ